MARLSASMLCAALCAVVLSTQSFAALALAAAPPGKQGQVNQPNYIVCEKGTNHCCCNKLPFRVESHPGPVTAEPTRNFFIDGNQQQYTCFQSSCQSNCAGKFQSPNCA